MFDFILDFTIIFSLYAFIQAGIGMCRSQTAISAVIFLITCFLLSSIMFFELGLDFLGIMYLIVYVGAISILFLFVIMVTPLKNTSWTSSDLSSNVMIDTYSTIYENKEVNNSIFGILFDIEIQIRDIFSFLSYLYLFVVVSFYFYFENIFNFKYDEFDDFFLIQAMDNVNELNFLAQTLYNFYSFIVIICGFLLLIGLIGSIILTYFNYYIILKK